MNRFGLFWTRHWSDNIKMFSVNYMWPGPCIWINVCCVLSASLTIDWNGRRVPFTFHPFHLPLFSTLFSFIILTSEMLVVFHHFYWCSIKVHLPPNCLFIQISGIWIPKKKEKRKETNFFLLLRGLAYVQCFDSISTTFLESLQLPTERVVMCRMKTVKKRRKKTRRIWNNNLLSKFMTCWNCWKSVQTKNFYTVPKTVHFIVKYF